MKHSNFSRIALAVALSVGMGSVAIAQETSSSIRGSLVGPQGNPAANTSVMITHVPSGSVKRAETNASGHFSAKGLRVGGPYSIKVDSQQFEDTLVKDVYLMLGEPYVLNLALEAEQAIENIVVTGSQVSSIAFGEKGPSANFSLQDIERAPAINRDIKDLIRIDPRIYIDESSNDAVQCAGASPRFNSLTLDGVRMNDNFGLNSNGYPTERIPFSYDSIEQVAVELAPFDVQYGGFTACNINAVTKSGTNEIHGGVFFDYTNDSLRGTDIEGENIYTTSERDEPNFNEKRYGFNVGFPLLEDKLFLFASYEKLEGAEIFEYPGKARATDEEVARIAQISRDVYGYDPGGFASSLPVEDEKLLVKLDWNINEAHRASLVYNYNDGSSLSQSDSFSSALTFDGHFYERGAEMNSLVASLYSDWSDRFSTELRVAKTDLDNRQISLDQDTGFAEVQIRTAGGGTVYLGPDDSRQSNDLNWDNFTFKLAGTYYLDDHTITGGIEYEDLNVFNLFMQHTVGEYRFNNIDDFEAGTPARIYYNNSAGTNNPNDVAANFSYQQGTLYIQDEWTVNDDLTVLFGLRYDRYTSDDSPRFNQTFTDRFGFQNNANLDGIDLLQPRFGFNYAVSDALEVRGGLGLYSGGNPNVWISNAYSNDGIVQVAVRERVLTNFTNLFETPLIGGGRPIFDIPQEMFDFVAAQDPNGPGGSGVNATDPDFDIPSEWKYSLGATYVTEDEYIFTADLLFSDKQDSAIVKDLGFTDTGEDAPDGRPIYTGSAFQYLLTNVDGDDGESLTASLGASKEYDNGFRFTASYAFTDAEDVNPMTSSVAGSNFGNIAVSDPNNPGLATSNYEIRHRFTLNLSYSHEFFSGYATKISVFGSANEGRPYNYSFDDDGIFGDNSFFGNGRQLLYVPLENDPNVVYGEGFDLAAFNQFIADEGLGRGQIMARNGSRADWWTKFDVKVEQDFPGFMDGHKGSAYLIIENFGNLLNDDWGVLRQGSFVSEAVVNAEIVDGQYVYNEYFEATKQTIQEDASLWEIRVGVKYNF